MKSRSLRLSAALGTALILAACAWIAAPAQDAATSAQLQPAPATQPAEPQFDSRLLTGLIGSKHDFSTSDRHPRELCLPCHAPHLPTGQVPLLDQRPATTQPMRTYQAIGVELDSASVLCLSCHDGVIASDVYTTAHSTQFVSQLGASQLGSRGLLGHPIGIRYPVADPRYNPPQAVTADGRMQLPGGRIQCTTCHDPHNTERHEGLLVISNDRSRLCLACHRL